MQAYRRIFWLLMFAILTAPIIVTVQSSFAFAGVSPTSETEANLPAIGGVDDYMHQDGDGPPSASAPMRSYSPSLMPPQGFSQQTAPPQGFDYRYADPNAARAALIGAAVVGAVAVGLWAIQQHELQREQHYARRHAYSRHGGYPY